MGLVGRASVPGGPSWSLGDVRSEHSADADGVFHTWLFRHTGLGGEDCPCVALTAETGLKMDFCRVTF